MVTEDPHFHTLAEICALLASLCISLSKPASLSMAGLTMVGFADVRAETMDGPPMNFCGSPVDSHILPLNRRYPFFIELRSLHRDLLDYGDPSPIPANQPSSFQKRKMPSAQDPFYVVKEEIQESIDKLQSDFHHWEQVSIDPRDRGHLLKELLSNCESVGWQVDELEKAISVAARDPSWYGIDEVELEKRKRWTSTARAQVTTIKKVVESGKESNGTSPASLHGIRQELMRLPDPNGANRSYNYTGQDYDDILASHSDRQLLLINQQDEELDELSASVQRIGGIGLTIHQELLSQEKILDELGMEIESTTNRLDFVQKKVAVVMKKAGAKGQIMMILFLMVLFVILFVLVFLT